MEVAGWRWQQRPRHSTRTTSALFPSLELASSLPSPALGSASFRSGGSSTGDGRDGDGRDGGAAACACAMWREVTHGEAAPCASA